MYYLGNKFYRIRVFNDITYTYLKFDIWYNSIFIFTQTWVYFHLLKPNQTNTVSKSDLSIWQQTLYYKLFPYNQILVKCLMITKIKTQKYRTQVKIKQKLNWLNLKQTSI